MTVSNVPFHLGILSLILKENLIEVRYFKDRYTKNEKKRCFPIK